ncbi:MAG TPA: GGDEF domain-containing protein [Solirubrobacteraceae bacterium]|nr:GGDEF domain-containing protein [Solirubrobacteraceae bacterium]
MRLAELERGRLRENARNFAWCIGVVAVCCTGIIVSAAAQTGWLVLTLCPLTSLTTAIFFLAVARRRARPEVWGTWTTVAVQLEVAAVAATLEGAHGVLLLCLLPAVAAAPYVLNASGSRLVIAATFCALLCVDVTDLRAVVRSPAFPAALLLLATMLACLSLTQMRTEFAQRAAATLDPLTSLLNRSSLTQRFAELSHQGALAGAPLSVVAIDIDHFKAINDHHGHAAGDAVLREVADRIRANVRAFQPAYRLGGEEFLVLLPGVGLTDALAIAERIRKAIASEACQGITVSASLGVSSARGVAIDSSLLERADRQLYAAKSTGRNRVCCEGERPAAARAA